MPGMSGTGSDDDYYDLGPFRRSVSTNSDIARTWFIRGLVWSYAFNHDESAKCFRRAIAADSGFAFAYWGIAYSLGPNYNKPWDSFDDKERQETIHEAHVSLQKAKEHSSSASLVEQSLINALQHRFSGDASVVSTEGQKWNLAYAEAMAAVYADFPDDLDVTALYADALMNLTPWRLWDIRTGKPAEGAHTLRIKEVIERGLSQEPFHPGLLHLYIHLMEMSSRPEVALRLADNLRGLIPDAGHLNHMPTHLDILCGDYRRAIASNTQAILADEKFVARDTELNFYALYRAHNLHFRIYAAMFAGISQVALDTASQVEKTLPEELLRVTSPPMADWLEGFLAMRVHVLVRFGKWDDIIALPLPEDKDLYCTVTAMMYYAKGVAFAATGRIPEAEEQRSLFRASVKKVPSSRTIFNNLCIDILAIASWMLDGELEYRHKNYDTAFQYLQTAIKLDDALPYDEPWGWMQPTRHALGALLLEQGHVQQALAVYAADLGFSEDLPRAQQHRGNVWALHGYHECLVKLGREAEAKIVRPQLQMALAVADVEIKASCFCRREV